MAYVNTNTIGANLNASDGTTAQFALGSEALGNSGTEWKYIIATGAISAGDLVAISAAGTGQRATATQAATGYELAFAQYAFADGEYGWVAKRGNPLTVYVSSTSTLQAVLYVAGTSGKLATTASSGTLAGIALQTASTTGTAQTYTAIVTWPKCVGAGN